MGFSTEPSQVAQQGITGKELSIFSSRLNAHKFPVVLAWLEQGLIDPEALITHVFEYQILLMLSTFLKKTERAVVRFY
jgi:L-gulonate 5-dehydrogenase